MIKNKLINILQSFENGFLIATMPSGEIIKSGNESHNLKADVQIHSWRVLNEVISKGDIGLAQMYMQGLVTTSNIANLLMILGKNAEKIDSIINGNALYTLIFRIKNLFRKNTHTGSKKNIEYHYDLGNDFYSLWLDKTMTYSSAYFKNENESLSQAQVNKYNLILENLNKEEKDILEIGCGWGGFINEAEKQGYNVKGLTLSNQQKKYVDELIAKNHFKSQCILQDYRTENQKFSNIVSIEMFEAVGKEYWNVYFQKIKECLKENGRAVIQTITIDDSRYKSYEQTSDFIREYIFPGGFLPSNAIFQGLAQEHGLKVIDVKAFGQSYTQTLLMWLANFCNAEKEVFGLGYDRQFAKMWEFYLAYCASGFDMKRTDVIQYTLQHA